MNRRDFIKNRMQKHYNILVERGYDVFALMLHGSQNYEMDEYSDEYFSDVDTKAIIIPSLHDIIFHTEYVSDIIVTEDNEHIDVKDIRKMFESFKKQNINYLEILFTPYYIVSNEYIEFFNELRDNANDIVKISKKLFISAACGTCENKYRHYLKPTPHSEAKIAEFGYDPKELHHLLRCKEFTERFVCNGESFNDCLVSKRKDWLMRVKKGTEYTLEQAIEEAEAAKKWFDKLKAEQDSGSIPPWPRESQKAGEIKLNMLIEEVLVKKLRSELL